MSDRFKIGLIIFGAAALVAGLLAFSLTSLMLAESIIYVVVGFGVAVATIAVFVWRIKKEQQNIKAGLPLEDERSKRVRAYAGAKSYLATLYLLIGLMFYNSLGVDVLGVPELNVTQVIEVAIIAMIVIFVSFWAYYHKKGVE